MSACCSALQCVTAWCSVLQRVAAASSVGASEVKFEYMSQCNPVCDSTLQCAAVCCSVLQPHLPWGRRRPSFSTCHSAIQCVAVYYSVLQSATAAAFVGVSEAKFEYMSQCNPV